MIDHINLSRYFVEKEYKTGCPRCDEQIFLNIILILFMEHGITLLREMEKLCGNDIRYLCLLDDMKALSFATLGNLIHYKLTDSTKQIFIDVNSHLFEKVYVNLIDGTKIEANFNHYT